MDQTFQLPKLTQQTQSFYNSYTHNFTSLNNHPSDHYLNIKNILYSQNIELLIHQQSQNQLKLLIHHHFAQQQIQKRGIIIAVGDEGIGKTNSILKTIKNQGKPIIRFKAQQPSSFKRIKKAIIKKQLNQKNSTNKRKKNIKQNNFEQLIIFVEDIDKLLKKNFYKQFDQLISQMNSHQLLLIGQTSINNFIYQLQKNQEYNIKNVHKVIFKQNPIQIIRQIITSKMQSINSFLQKQNLFQILWRSPSMSYFLDRMLLISKGNLRIILKYVWLLIYSLGFNHEKCVEIDIKSIKNILEVQNGGFSICRLEMRAQIGLIALYTYFKRTDNLTIKPKQLDSEVKWVEDSLNLSQSNILENIIQDLLLYNIINLRSNKNQIVLKLSLKDIQKAFLNHCIFAKFIEK